ncbi:hypothetical protein NKR23_g1434 [Pleurostoma richardsiae]|uniref:Uncharacterized protein n=1 Tax=Pleurostoma richardsiae TaxID=41990 RepID=A0AA38SAL7_9PEZI|nr:hypothetical protein NKR23_g1434 [Pleurostoma richardsiae]
MSSQNLERGTFVYAGSSPEPSERPKRKTREANVYDAVAGRVSTNKTLSTHKRSQKQSSAGQYQLRDATHAPEEVLFARQHAPQRYAEKDIYFAHEALPDGGRGVLPDSDALKAVHGYASLFYEALGQRRRAAGRDDCFVGSRLVDERSMDETALLAFGILLEEAAREALGRRGDLVFTEGVEDADGDEDEGSGAGTERMAVGLEDQEDFWKRRLPKRRKLSGDAG